MFRNSSDNLMKIRKIQFECKGKTIETKLQKEKKMFYFNTSQSKLRLQLDTTITITALQLSQILCLLFDAESGTTLVQLYLT